jgi:hypothetical protein
MFFVMTCTSSPREFTKRVARTSNERGPAEKLLPHVRPDAKPRGRQPFRIVDSWHQPDPMVCRPVRGARELFQVQGEYGPESDWGWRIGLSLRAPAGELVLQMTNVAPWGEEARAVRMTCTRA